MTDIPDKIMERARRALEPWLHNIGHEATVARAIMEAEERGRKHGPMLCTSCGTVCSTDRCDCTDMGVEGLSMRVRYIDFLQKMEHEAEERGRLAGLEEAAKVADEATSRFAGIVKHDGIYVGPNALSAVAAAIRALKDK